MATAQTVSPSEADLKQFQHDLETRSLVLRNYSADPVAKFFFTGDRLIMLPPNETSFATFSVRKMRMDGAVLKIIGARKMYVRLQGTQKLAPTQTEVPMELDITLSGVAGVEGLAALANQLFFTDIAHALQGIPEEKAAYMPRVYSSETKSLVMNTACDVQLAVTRPPRLIHQVDPDLSLGDVAHAHGTKNHVLVAVTVGVDGVPRDAHIVGHRGPMDLPALTAASQYRFEPALKDGKPVPVLLNIEFNLGLFN